MDETTRSKQEALDKRYIRMASIWAENSYCQRRQVGALIVKDKMIISDGYNGTPSGFENVCEDENNVTKPYVLHAEANAITKIARSNNSSNGATMYGFPLHRMCQAHHPGRYQACRILRKISAGRRYRTAETSRHRGNICFSGALKAESRQPSTSCAAKTVNSKL